MQELLVDSINRTIAISIFVHLVDAAILRIRLLELVGHSLV